MAFQKITKNNVTKKNPRQATCAQVFILSTSLCSDDLSSEQSKAESCSFWSSIYQFELIRTDKLTKFLSEEWITATYLPLRERCRRYPTPRIDLINGSSLWFLVESLKKNHRLDHIVNECLKNKKKKKIRILLTKKKIICVNITGF